MSRAVRIIGIILAIWLSSCGSSGGDKGREELSDRLLHYWDSVPRGDISDPDLMEQKMVDFLYLAMNADSLTRRECWRILFREVSVDCPDRIVTDYLGDPGSPLYSPPLFEEYLETLATEVEKGSASALRVEYILADIRLNSPGDTIPDIPLVTADGDVTSLHRLVSGTRLPSLLFIYDPACPSCDIMIERLAGSPPAGCRVIAISVTGEMKVLPEGWLCTGLADPDDLDGKFSLRSLPSSYLVSPACIVERREL